MFKKNPGTSIPTNIIIIVLLVLNLAVGLAGFLKED